MSRHLQELNLTPFKPFIGTQDLQRGDSPHGHPIVGHSQQKARGQWHHRCGVPVCFVEFSSCTKQYKMDLFVHVLISREAIWQKKRHRCTLPRVANSACLQSGLQEGTSRRKKVLPKPGVPSAACYMLVLCTAPMPILQSLYSKKSISTGFTIFETEATYPRHR